MKNLIFFIAVYTPICILAQFGAPPGEPGSTAIHKDSSIFIGWATGIDVVRGLLDIADPSAMDNGTNVASYGDPQDALGYASGVSTEVVSLGDSGYATLTFDYAIVNRPGYDFAVFENGFADDYIELAFVEVSSDGNQFVRFPSTSLTQISQQIGPFETMDLEQMHNLAGKYRVGYGTPFDLEDLADSSGIDLQNITHIRIVDAIGTIDPTYATYDAQGNMINDPYPTDFAAGGFDLDGVGVIHFEGDVGVKNKKSQNIFSVYPNPIKKGQNIQLRHLPEEAHTLMLFGPHGRKVLQTDKIAHELETRTLSKGLHLLVISNQKGEILEKVKIISY